MRTSIPLLLFLIPRILFCQLTKADYYNKIDNRLYVYSKSKGLTFDSVVSYVNRNFTSNEDKVRAYYSWIATNITYDTEYLDLMLERKRSGQSINSGNQHPDTVLLKRKAVCEGHALLLNKFCEASSIPSYLVGGYSKTPDGAAYTEIMHAWNAVKPDSTWYLLDVTWSGGYVNSENQFAKRFSDKYFFTKPEEFVKDHFPLDPMWQLLNPAVSKNKFFKGADTSQSLAYFNFTDSLEAYIRLSEREKKYHDCFRYYAAEPDNLLFQRDMDIIVNNTAADYFQEASRHFDIYKEYEKKNMGKHPTSAACKKAKVLLNVSKKDMLAIIDYLNGKTALTPEYTVIFKEMIESANKNIASIKQSTDAINTYMKNMNYK